MTEVLKSLGQIFKKRGLRGPQETISTQIQEQPFAAGYTESDIYNPEARDEELDRLTEELKKRQDELQTVQISIHSPRELRAYENWRQAQRKVWDIFTHLANVDEPYLTRIKQAKAGLEPPLAVGEYCHYHVLRMGGELLLRDLIRQELSFPAQLGLAERFQPYTDLQAYTYGSARLAIKIGGVSLTDILETDQRKDGSSAQYRFLMDSMLLARHRSHQSIFEANRQGLLKRFPNVAKYLIEGLQAGVRAGILSTPDIVDHDIQSNLGIPKEVAQRGKQFVQRIQNIREGVYRTVLNPNSPEFNSLQEAVTFYIRQGRFERTNALYILGLDRLNHIYQMYRMARGLQEQGIQSNFYRDLTDAVGEYTHSGLTDGIILNEENIEEILDPEQSITQSLVTTQSFRTIIASIFTKGSQILFDEIDPSVVNATGFVRPQRITAAFDQNRPQRFTIYLQWGNSFGESTKMNLYFDTKQEALRDAFDWNLLKLPGDPDMRVVFNTAMSATQAILTSINAAVPRAYQERQQRRDASLTPQSNTAKQKRERFTDEAYKIRKQARQEARASSSTERVDLLETTKIATVPKTIIMSESTELGELLNNIHSAERNDVLKSIENFNNRGVGEFTRKRSKGPCGETLYTLRVGRNRVLVYEIESSNGVRQFKIMDINDRSRIYRKNKV